MVTARGLVHAYGERRAVDGVDLGLGPGERVALAGPNGAGKSTLLRLVATLLRAQSGSLVVLGEEIPGGTRAARRGIGYLAHDPLAYLDLTARQNLELYGDLYAIDDRDRRIDELLDRVGLLGRAEDTVRTFSRGMAQRLALARMLLHRPRLLLLDEPHASLDAPGAALLDDELAAATADGRAAIIVTHEVERVARVADRLVVLCAGRVVLDEPTARLDPMAVRRRYEEVAG
ncbi:MAG: heme ABC exporter ATP-binding protein CcmA [Actinobacteria bacterium]|nr:heme ABC exporter ATP-binding protein CcmA [Actinomycetota bacterium]